MSSKKKRNKDRFRGAFNEMIPECPYCHARSYPRIIGDPQNEEEAKALFCGSCKTDLRPVIEYHKAEEKKRQAMEFIAAHGNADIPAAPAHVIEEARVGN